MRIWPLVLIFLLPVVNVRADDSVLSLRQSFKNSLEAELNSFFSLYRNYGSSREILKKYLSYAKEKKRFKIDASTTDGYLNSLVSKQLKIYGRGE